MPDQVGPMPVKFNVSFNADSFSIDCDSADLDDVFRLLSLWLNSQQGGKDAVKLDKLTSDLDKSTEALGDAIAGASINT